MGGKYVYRYFDPIRLEYIYVGKGGGNRAYEHLTRKDRHPLTGRIMWLKKQGAEPVIDFICKDVDEELALLVEVEAIAKYGRKCDGGCLLNLTLGGEGMSGFTTNKGRKASLSTRAKLSAIHTGRKRSPEQNANMSRAQKEAQNRPEVKAKLSKSNSNPSPEIRARKSEAAKLRWARAREVAHVEANA